MGNENEKNFIRELTKLTKRMLNDVDVKTLSPKEREKHYNRLKGQAIIEFADISDLLIENDYNEKQCKEIISVFEQMTKVLKDIAEVK